MTATKIVLAGGYVVQSKPSGATFENALARALARKNGYSRSDLVLVETQIVSGTNFRFTFRNAVGSLKQVVIYVPISGFSSPVNPQSVFNAGGWSQTTDPSSYADALAAIVDEHPQIKSYIVSGVEVQVVAGRNFRIGLQSNSAKSIKYALYKVCIDLSNKATVT